MQATYAETLRDIREHPEKHQHKDLNEVAGCSMINGEVNLLLIQAHEGTGKSTRCDVREGPCSCGGWH